APTAQTSPRPEALIEYRTEVAVPAGTVTPLHLVPFQCSARGPMAPLGLVLSPAAQMSRAEITVMACRKVPAWPDAGLGTMVHSAPFQCSISAPVGAAPAIIPTAAS